MEEKKRRFGRRKAKRARDRNLARQLRRQAMMEGKLSAGNEHAFFRRRFPSYDEEKLLHRGLAWLFSTRSPVAKLTAVVATSILIFFVGTYVVSGRIFPNVYAMGVSVGELTLEEAERAIQEYWDTHVTIEITVDGEPLQRVRTDELGLSIDANAMAHSAKAAGLAGLPFGVNIDPFVEVSHSRAQSLLLDLTESIYARQYEAGYKWSGGRLVTVPGRRGRHLDITDSLKQLKRDATAVVTYGRFELPTFSLEPTVFDSSPFLDEAIVFLSNGLRLQAYDPFADQMFPLQVDQKLAADWLIAGENGLAVRDDAFGDFIQDENRKWIKSGRYIDKLIAKDSLQEALNFNSPDIVFRLNYLPQGYEVERGDTGYRIGRKKGIPYELIRDANPTLRWELLSVGDEVQIPSRDALIPEDPVPHKRIIVDLESQWLIAFENKQLLFSWPISSGRETAPTYPGIFQILTHVPIASGGSYALCNEAGTNCNQWRMKWFMGVYEVVPGLMNGFHGAVELPNGNYLGGGGVYEPSTFGCVMSLDSKAEQLFTWAETGTMVEIISNEFAPESELGRYALELISTIDTSWRPASA